MNYVGSRVYSTSTFEREATVRGVSRGIAPRLLRSVQWGDPVLLAMWMPNREEQARFKVENGRMARLGDAEVFGYFRVAGLNMDAPEEAKVALAGMLRVVSVNMEPIHVERRCGSYTIQASYEVLDTIEEIADKAAEVEGLLGVRFKWFIGGRYAPIRPPVTLLDARFTRGLTAVEVEGLSLDAPARQTTFRLDSITEYKRKLYRPVAERA